MTHPTVEEVAEHLEGVLDLAADRRVREHVAGCAACAAVARDLSGVSQTLRDAAAEPAPIPGDVARRIETALAAEAGPAPVTSLDERRARRRKVLAGGLLAAAAATVVAVGVGELDLGGSGAGGSAGQVSTAESAPDAAAQEDAAEDRPGLRPHAAQGAPGSRPQEFRPDALQRRRALAALVDGAAAAHRRGDDRRERRGCVAAALGAAGSRRAASYAVTLPGPPPGVPGVVVLRPAAAPRQGVLLACRPDPRVLLRRGLDD